MIFDRRSSRPEHRSRQSRRRSPRAFKVFVPVTLVISLVLLLSVVLLGDVRAPGEAESTESDAGATIAFFDVGQGLSAGIVTSDGASLLYDFGTSRADVEEMIVPFFRDHDVDEIDYAILSHPHQDHLGGLPAFLEAMPVSLFLDPVVETTNQTYLQSLEMVEDLAVPARAARQGDQYKLGEHITFQLLWPTDDLLTEGDGDHRINDNSTVVRVDIDRVTVLLTGDIEGDAETALVQTDGQDLDVDILQVAHHGSYTSTSTDLLTHTTPEMGIISAGLDNQYGHPHDEALQRLREHEVQIYRTDVDGTVIIRASSSTFDVTTERTDLSWTTRQRSMQPWIGSSMTSMGAPMASWYSTIGSN